MIPLSDPDLSHRSFPFVNVAIVATCTLLFLYELSIGPAGRVQFFFTHGLIPGELTRAPGVIGLPWYNVLSSMFVHGSISHFGFNMLFLWVFGDNVEDRLGHTLYLGFYMCTGVAATLAQVAIDPGSMVPIIGASGAIAGVLGAYFLLYPYSRIRTLVIFFFITTIRVPAVVLLGFWITMQCFGGLGSLGPSAHEGGVAYFAHIGGFLAGVTGVALLKLVLWRERLWTTYRPTRRRWWRGREL